MTSCLASAHGRRMCLQKNASQTSCSLYHHSHKGSTVIILLHCRNSQHTILGFSWGSADEKKMQKSFGLGRQQLFDRFLDLQLVSQGLGYQMMGLTKLTETVLGCPNHKSKKVTPPCHCPDSLQAFFLPSNGLQSRCICVGKSASILAKAQAKA